MTRTRILIGTRLGFRRNDNNGRNRSVNNNGEMPPRRTFRDNNGAMPPRRRPIFSRNNRNEITGRHSRGMPMRRMERRVQRSRPFDNNKYDKFNNNNNNGFNPRRRFSDNNNGRFNQDRRVRIVDNNPRFRNTYNNDDRMDNRNNNRNNNRRGNFRGNNRGNFRGNNRGNFRGNNRGNNRDNNRGGRDNNNFRGKPTNESLDMDLDGYFKKDKDSFANRLDGDLDAYKNSEPMNMSTQTD